MRNPSTVFFVTTSINPSLMSDLFNFATSEYRKPVKQQNKKISRTLSRAACVGKNTWFSKVFISSWVKYIISFELPSVPFNLGLNVS